jgi:hypothetical protein
MVFFFGALGFFYFFWGIWLVGLGFLRILRVEGFYLFCAKIEFSRRFTSNKFFFY